MLKNDLFIFGVIGGVVAVSWSVWPPLALLWVALWLVLIALCVYFGNRYFQESYLDAKLSFVDVDDSLSSMLAPNLDNEATLDLSVVIPAFNEESRIVTMLDDCLEWLQQQSFTWEIIVVDDCSRDTTADVVLQYAKQHRGLIQLRRLKQNRGKGFAVKQGAYCSRGKQILMADADGATKFADVGRLQEEMQTIQKDGQGVVCGSRKHLVGSDAVAKRTLLRNLLMYIFHFCVDFTFWAANGSTGLEDTQCGFKLFSRASARKIFKQLHIERWCFDVEVLLIARQLKYPVAEVPVNWHEIPGSKLRFTGMILMGLELVLLCVMYRFRFWRVQTM